MKYFYSFVVIFFLSTALAFSQGEPYNNQYYETIEPQDLPANKFTGSFTMTFTYSDGTPPLSLDVYADTRAVAFELVVPEDPNQTARFIVDPVSATLTSLLDDKKDSVGVTSKIPTLIRIKTDNGIIPARNIKVTIDTTDEYKVIEGFNCRKYVIWEDTVVQTVSWITHDNGFSTKEVLSMLALTNKMKNDDIARFFGGMDGMVLASTVTADGKQFSLAISNVKSGETDKSKFSALGYSLTDMKDMKPPGN